MKTLSIILAAVGELSYVIITQDAKQKALGVQGAVQKERVLLGPPLKCHKPFHGLGY